MSNGIWIIGEQGVGALTVSPFESEDDFQDLLARHPDLLDPDPSDGAGSWILVDREISIPDRAEGVGRWSLDHLFLDREGVPTLVEVKRASDTHARREVVAQMLDYAAHSALWWPVDSIRRAFEERCLKAGLDPAKELESYIGTENVESYWRDVDTNFRAGRVRLLFVADQISSELRAIVEFLNHQMSPAEVLALELKRYVARNGIVTLVPTIYGQTAETIARKNGTSATRWGEEEFWPAIPVAVIPAVRRLHDWGKGAGLIQWGVGKAPSFLIKLKKDGPTLFSFYGGRWGDRLYVHAEELKNIGVSEEVLQGTLSNLNSVHGLSLNLNKGTPSFKVSKIALNSIEEILGSFDNLILSIPVK